MAKKLYFPQSQVTLNLYTKGGEYINSVTGEDYKGFYFKTSSNQYYTGKTPQDKPNTLLIPSVSLTSEVNEEFTPEGLLQQNNKSYWVIGNPNYRFNQTINPNLPLYSHPKPTEQDYKIGEFERYFVSKTNEIKYVEVDKFTYNQYLNRDPNVAYQLFIPVRLSWVLTGKREEAYKVNIRTVERTQFRLGLQGFVQYFKGRFTQFYR